MPIKYYNNFLESEYEDVNVCKIETKADYKDLYKLETCPLENEINYGDLFKVTKICWESLSTRAEMSMEDSLYLDSYFDSQDHDYMPTSDIIIPKQQGSNLIYNSINYIYQNGYIVAGILAAVYLANKYCLPVIINYMVQGSYNIDIPNLQVAEQHNDIYMVGIEEVSLGTGCVDGA